MSERQITKDLDILRHGLRFPIQRSGDGYYFEQIPRLPTVSFSFEEALALLLAVRAGGTLAGVDGESLSAAIGRLESLLPRELRAVLRASEGAGATSLGRQEMLASLSVAVAQRQQVRLEYAAASSGEAITDRVVNPDAVIPYVKSWHLVGHCHLRNDVRLFKLDRIRRLEQLSSRFPEPTHFDLGEFLDRGWGLMRGVDGPVEEVVLRFYAPSASFVAEERWHSTQRVEREPGGSIRFSVTVQVTPELCRWVYKHGRDVDVLAPDHLRQWLLDEARAVVAREPAAVG